ncbi:isoprenoid synthase domain-containing protein [Penicillium herquei]|nr:isoprenoid synthase domain-containing protein [Penicillium herquei]
MTAFLIWIFIWDDEVDTNDTLISSDAKRVRAYSQQSMKYIRQELGLPANRENGKSIEDTKIKIDQIHPNMILFSEVGRMLVSGTDIAQRERFYDELVDYIDCVEAEHSFRLRGAIPTTEEYMRFRTGSVACRAFILLTEWVDIPHQQFGTKPANYFSFMLKFRLPEATIDSAAMQSLWNESTTLGYVLNDLYSVQKEIGLEKVTHDIMAMIRESMETFEAAAECLEKSTGGDAQLSSHIASFIQACRYFTTGPVAWYCETPRYGMAECSGQDASANFVF